MSDEINDNADQAQLIGWARCKFDESAVTAVSLGLVIILVSVLAIDRLKGTPYAINVSAAWAGAASVVSMTAVAAVKLWALWALCSMIVAALLLQFDPELDISDAILAGAGAIWVIAYFIGFLLGPFGYFGYTSVWVLICAGLIQVARKPPPVQLKPLSTGQKITLLAIGLLSIGMIPLQLGSPVAPYMDVLSYPASVERILAFKIYLPFDNDPYGCWGARAQTPSLELFYAALALGASVKQGILAHSAVMMPMAALIIWTTYRFGVTCLGDVGAGYATLLLFFTNMFRRLPGMRGTALDFALVALGLAFFFDQRRSRTLLALGCVFLGTAVAGHAIDGALAMAVAGVGSLAWLLIRDYQRVQASVIGLTGAVLIAVPELMIGLGRPVPYLALSVAQICGVGVILFAVRDFNRNEIAPLPALVVMSKLSTAVLVIGAIYGFANLSDPFWRNLWQEFPILFALMVIGLLIWIVRTSTVQAVGRIVTVIALLAGLLYPLGVQLLNSAGGDVFHSGLADIGLKLEQYWYPYFFVFPAAMLFSAMSAKWPRAQAGVLSALLVLIIYPWYPRFHVDYDYNEHSIAENWGIDLSTAAGGFWVTTPDSRFTLDEAGIALVRFLKKEQAAGRITTGTHILHLTHDVTVLGSFNRFAVFTGINDDPVVYYIPETDIFYGYVAGSRVRMVSELGEAIAQQPPYILEQVSPPPGMPDRPPGYQEVFHQGELRLLRRTGMLSRR